MINFAALKHLVGVNLRCVGMCCILWHLFLN